VSSVRLLHVTPHELVVCKPAGLPSETPRDPGADSLISRLRTSGFADPRLVHRLDAPTCGVMMVALTPEAAAHYSTEIAARRWKKLYVAELAVPVARAQALVGNHKAYLSTEGRKAVVVRSGGKPSFLTIAHVAPVPGADKRSHALVRLQTGRFHQIRVMLSALGAPLAGDGTYGGSTDDRFYLEQILLGARAFGEEALSVWRAPEHGDRPAWSAALHDAVNAEEASLRREA
jgi:tRNA pseudouridine32 synthase/23S rRNA pseudouridine746 synthase